jgi:hypothetical protein
MKTRWKLGGHFGGFINKVNKFNIKSILNEWVIQKSVTIFLTNFKTT